MKLHKPGHIIADTVSDLIGDLPHGDYNIFYGILRHNLYREEKPWFEVDKGYWGASHYDGYYRLSLKGTQAAYRADHPFTDKADVIYEPWKSHNGYALICPPSEHVCALFGIDYAAWLIRACRSSPRYVIRNKGTNAPVDWGSVSRVVTFNSTIGFEALRRGIEVISSPEHSLIGSYTKQIEKTFDFNREPLFNFAQAHQFRLSEKCKIENLIGYYLNAS